MDAKLNLDFARKKHMPLEEAVVDGSMSSIQWWDIGGASVGAIAYALMQENNPPRRTLVHVLVGTTSAIFLSPMVCAYFGLTGDPGVRGVAFLSGLFGVVICRTLIQWAEKYAPEALSRIIGKVLGPLPVPPVPQEKS
jgi:uncharacterized membrane protein YeaQ/YmgE (transglycosylase-associated protein family)